MSFGDVFRLDFWTHGRGLPKTAVDTYSIVVAQARNPAFYERFGVPDTLDGRYDMLVIHMALLLRRLSMFAPGDKPTRRAPLPRLAQLLFDLMEKDLKRNVRLIGVRETAVGREGKKMVRAFYGRAYSYEMGLREESLEQALRENLYRNTHPSDDQVRRMAAYMFREAERLRRTSEEVFLNGGLSFGPPEVDETGVETS